MRYVVQLVAGGCCCVLAAASAFAQLEGSRLDPAYAISDQQPPALTQGAPLVSSLQGRAANPLWGIPLDRLSATRDRPIFSPSRRPPPAETPPPAVVTAPEVQEPIRPERPQLSLVGTVVNGNQGLAIFVDPGSKTPLRIRTGADYQGWILRHVEARSATLKKGEDVVILYFTQQPGQLISPVTTDIAETPVTPTAPPLAQAGPPFLSPESRLLRMHQRQRSGRRQL
ncbi:hypothetical protein [Bradyrhizobium sp. SRS-191]|uniref:hypothetical protein n=1 Tax=Bradyrhizobium sp. SRS-191 TaxID=2962606 RepID=UPI00211F418E|nr:hypothetical protein [Bradyrhizobium sp. SRS-191]